MPIGLGIASIAVGGLQALLNFGAQAKARNDQLALGRESLDFQKDQARDAKEQAQATRVDAYGNTVSYDRILKQWNVELTPEQERILRAGEREQLLTLTEDAERRRETARRSERRAVQADDYLDQIMAEYQFERPESEGAIRDELSSLMSIANQQGTDQAKDVIGQQALRTGATSTIPQIVQAIDSMFGQRLARDQLQARGQAATESNAREGAHEGKYQNAIRTLAALSQSVPSNAPEYSRAPGQTQNVLSQAIAQLSNAISSGSALTGNAYGQLVSAAGNAPQINLSGVQAGLGQLGDILAARDQTPEQQALRFMDLGNNRVVAFDPFTGLPVNEYGYTPTYAPQRASSSSPQAPRYFSNGGGYYAIDPNNPYSPIQIMAPPTAGEDADLRDALSNLFGR